MTQRFTIDGSPELEARLDRWCADFARDVLSVIPERELEAIVLGGGYGRGEGGVWRTTDGEQAYNDLEFYFFVRGPLLLRERQFKKRVHEVTHAWSEKTWLPAER